MLLSVHFNYVMQISNSLGALSGLVQLVLYAWYYKSTPKDSKDVAGKPTAEVQLSDTATGAARV